MADSSGTADAMTENVSALPDDRVHIPIFGYQDDAWHRVEDVLAMERPLEIHIAGAEPLITMRTPGHDRELAAGLLYNEGVVENLQDIVYLEHSSDEADIVRVMLKPEARQRLDRMARSTLMTSACGVCGKPSFRMPDTAPLPESADSEADIVLPPGWLLQLPDRMRQQQGTFSQTGGLHAAALFEAGGNLLYLREDVGRHNALDKLAGTALLADQMPLSRHVLMLSGRASYELLQKAVAAHIPVVCAISAPSSFAVEVARRFSVTLVGFLRGGRFNLYTGAERLQGTSE